MAKVLITTAAQEQFNELALVIRLRMEKDLRTAGRLAETIGFNSVSRENW